MGNSRPSLAMRSVWLPTRTMRAIFGNLGRLLGFLIDNAKYLRGRLAGRVGEGPTRQLFGDWIEVITPPFASAMMTPSPTQEIAIWSHS